MADHAALVRQYQARCLLVLFAAVSAWCLPAAPASGAEAVTVLRAARMLDVRAGRLVEDAVVVVAGERIRSVGVATVPESAPVLDLGEVTLVPGLIDAHTHLTYDSGNLLPAPGEHPGAAAGLRAVIGARNARTTLSAGFTTVRDLGACCFADVTLARAVDAGLTPGPRIIASSYVLTVKGGSCDQTTAEPGLEQAGPRQGIVDGRAEIVEAVGYLASQGAGVIKVCADRQFDAGDLRLMAEEARRRGLKLAVHVGEPASIHDALTAGADTIEHVGALDEALVELFLETGAILVPTIYTTEVVPFDRMPEAVRERVRAQIPLFREGLRKAVEAGVRIAFGSDSGEVPHGENWRELVELSRYGMSPAQVLRAATLTAAEALGVEDRGVIEPGKLADLVAVQGNPLESLEVFRRVSFVMKGGTVYRHELEEETDGSDY